MKATPIILAVCLSALKLHAAVFDFVETGGTDTDNSQNGGAGNVPIADAALASHTAAIDGIGITVTAQSTTGTATIGANSQGWGVSTNGESSGSNTRIEGDKGESLRISFDADVALSSLRLGNMNAGETVTLSFVSGSDPFVPAGSSLSIARDTDPNEDILLAADAGVSGQIGTIAAGTVIEISSASNDFLLNELTAVDPSAPAGNLITAIAATFPDPNLAANPNPGSNLGLTTVAIGDSKAQSFSLPAASSLTGFVFEIDGVVTSGHFSLDVYRAMDGLPWLLTPVFSDVGTLPSGLAGGDLLQIDLPAPLDVARGSYAVALSGLDATEFSISISNDSGYTAGAASRNNSAAGWRPLATTTADMVFAALGSASPPVPAAPAGAPNIIFIMADDYGWTDPQCGSTGPNVLGGTNYGSTYYQTPNLQRLSEEGLSFTHCFAHPNCAPTRAAILSGQYAPRSGNGVYVVNALNREAGSEQPTTFVPPSQNQDVPAAHTITSEILQAGGYVTAHFGKYHVGNHEGGSATLPENQGFDFNFGGKQDGAPGNYHASGGLFGSRIGPGLDAFAKDYSSEYITEILTPVANGNTPSALNGGDKHVEDAIGDAAIAFMRDHRNGAMSGRPFYLQLHNYAVHTPIGNSQARADLLAKYQGIAGNSLHSSNPYAAIAEGIDQTVGRILDYLDDPDGDGDNSDSIASETLILFTSDNGGHIGNTDNDPMRHRKGSFWNGGIRVPLIAWHPGTIDPGQQTDTIVHSVDFLPTLVGAAGLSLPAGITYDGSSFVTHMDDPVANQRDREAVFYHFPGYLDQRARPCEVAIKRVGGKDYKLIYTYDLDYTGNPSSSEDTGEGLDPLDEPWELYSFSDDISETTDLLDGSYSNWLLYGEIASEMAEEMIAWLEQPDADWDAKMLTERAGGATVPFPTTASLPSVEVAFEDSLRVTETTLDPDSGEVTLNWSGEAGFRYDIEVSIDLRTWTPVATDLAGVDGANSHTFTDALPDPNRRRYYRVVLRD